MTSYYPTRSDSPKPLPKKLTSFVGIPQVSYPVVLYSICCLTLLYFPFESVGSLAILQICKLASDPKAATLVALVVVLLYKFSMFWSLLVLIKCNKYF